MLHHRESFSGECYGLCGLEINVHIVILIEFFAFHIFVSHNPNICLFLFAAISTMAEQPRKYADLYKQRVEKKKHASVMAMIDRIEEQRARRAAGPVRVECVSRVPGLEESGPSSASVTDPVAPADCVSDINPDLAAGAAELAAEVEALDSEYPTMDAEVENTGSGVPTMEGFLEMMRAHAVKWNMRINQLTDLMRDLKPHLPYPDLPITGKTVLRLPMSPPPIISVPPGQYIPCPLKELLKYVPESVTQLDELLLDIGIDGIEITKSPAKTGWPILVHINGAKIRPLMMGFYMGSGEPSCVNEYLGPFVDELEELIRDGALVSKANTLMSVRIRLFCCDTKARIFVTGKRDV